LYAGTILFFGWALFSPRQNTNSWLYGCLLAVAGVLMMYTRFYGLLIFLGGFATYALLKPKLGENTPGFKKVALRAFLLSLPLLILELSLRPTSMLNSNINFFRNLERYGHDAIFRKNQAISLWQYIFEDRDVFDILFRLCNNTLLFLADYLPSFFRGYEWLAWLFPLGILFALRRVEVWCTLAILITALAPVLFILNLDQSPNAKGIDNRLVFHVYPIALLICLNGFFESITRGLMYLHRKERVPNSIWRYWNILFVKPTNNQI